MIRITDIEFSESCCGEHSFRAEYIRGDGVGFSLKRDPQTNLYSAQVYEPDQKTLRSDVRDVNEQSINTLLNQHRT